MAADNTSELKLPENFKEGTAVGGGDCFYDAIAQGLRQIMPERDFNIKALRKICKEVATQDHLLQNEIKSRIVQDARNSHDISVVMPACNISDDDIWNAYLASIEYTSDDIKRIGNENPHLCELLSGLKYGSTLKVPIWGRPDIEGRLICKKYSITLHLEEKQPNIGYVSQVIDQLGSRSVESVTTAIKSEQTIYDEENTIHIVNHNHGHFQPILRQDTDTSLLFGVHGTEAGVNIDDKKSSISADLVEKFIRQCDIKTSPRYGTKKGMLDQQPNLIAETSLKPKSVENFEVGNIDDGADSFFDAVAQCLGQLKPEMQFTVKSLRIDCKEIGEMDRQLREEVRGQIIKDAKAPYSECPSVTLPALSVSDSMLWNAYLERIEYTVDEVKRLHDENPNLYKSLTDCKYGSTLQAPIRGRPTVDGRLITRKYSIKLHYLIGSYFSGEGFRSAVVDQSKSFLVSNDDDYNEENTIHLISHTCGHFKPILEVTQSPRHDDCTLVDHKEADSIPVELPTENGVDGSVKNKIGESSPRTVDGCDSQGTFEQGPQRQTFLFPTSPRLERHQYFTKNQPASHGQKMEARKKKLLSFFSVLGEKMKLQNKFENLKDRELEELYRETLHLHDKQYLKLLGAIAEYANEKGSKGLQHFIRHENMVFMFRNEVATKFLDCGVYESNSHDEVDKHVKALHIVVWKYDVFKSKQPYTIYEKYDDFYNDKNPNKMHALLNHDLELTFFSMISEVIEPLKLHFKGEPFEEIQFLLTRFNYLSQKMDSMRPQNNTQMFNDFNYQDMFLVYSFFLYKQKHLLAEFVIDLNDRLLDNKLRKKINSEQADYKESYEDYWTIRDIDSLNRIINYIKLAESVEMKEDAELGQVIIERVLQVIGEFFKSSHQSPYLSVETKKYLKDGGVPVEVFIELRQQISHSFTLCKKIDIESEKKKIFAEMKSELVKLKKTVVAIFETVEAKQIKWVWGKSSEFVHGVDSNDILVIAIKYMLADIEVSAGKKMQSLLAQFRNNNNFKGIEKFSNLLNKRGKNPKISCAFSKRITTLKTILDPILLKNETLKCRYDKKNELIMHYKNDEKLQAAVELLLLDLMTVLTDQSLILRGLVVEDFVPEVGLFYNTSVRNFLGHGSTLIRTGPEDMRSEMIISCALNFINDEKELTALITLNEDDEIKEILFNELKNMSGIGKLNEIWLNETGNMNVRQKLKEHENSITVVFNSPDYKHMLIDVLYLSNDIFFLAGKNHLGKVIEKLNTDQSIDVNADKDGKTVLNCALSCDLTGKEAKVKKLINLLIEKGYQIRDEDVLVLKKNHLRPLFVYILSLIIPKDDVRNFEKMRGNDIAIAETGMNDLCSASKAGSRKIVSYLLKEGMDPNVADRDGCTPLLRAAQGGFPDIVVDLLRWKAKYNIGNTKNPAKNTPLQLAREGLVRQQNSLKTTKSNKKEKLNDKIKSYEQVIHLLELLEALFKTMKNGSGQVIEDLERLETSEFEAVTNARNDEGHTLLQVASIYRHQDVARKLLELLKGGKNTGENFKNAGAETQN